MVRVKRAPTWRLYATWEPRPEPPEAAVDRLLLLFDTLRRSSERGWTAALGKSTQPHPCRDRAATEWALRAGSFPIERRPKAGDFTRQHFYLGTFRRWETMVSIACGAREPLAGIETPNRIEITGTTQVDPQVLRELTVVVIAAFRPVWAFVGRGARPLFPIPGNAAPTVGWLTYLSASFGQVPPDPSLHAVSVPLFGTLVNVADKGEPLDESSPESLRAVEQALRSAKVVRRV